MAAVRCAENITVGSPMPDYRLNHHL